MSPEHDVFAQTGMIADQPVGVETPSLQGNSVPFLSMSTEQTDGAVRYPIVASPGIGLSLEARAEEIRRVVGFTQEILAYRLDETSQRMYCRDFHAYLVFAGQEQYNPLEPATLSRWLAHLAHPATVSAETGRPYSPNTINRMASAVRRMMKEAGKQHYLEPGLASAFGKVEGVSKQALKHNRVRIEPATMRQMAESTDRSRLIEQRNLAILLTLASTGLRVETFRTLTEDQVVRREGGYAVHIRSKNEVEFRDVQLSDEAYAAIQAWLALRPTKSGYLFTHCAGGKSDGEHPRLTEQPLSAVSIRAIIKAYARAVGMIDEEGKVPVKPHDFRRFVGTMIAKKYGPKQAQLLLGHKQIATTFDHYVLEEAKMGITNHLF